MDREEIIRQLKRKKRKEIIRRRKRRIRRIRILFLLIIIFLSINILKGFNNRKDESNNISTFINKIAFENSNEKYTKDILLVNKKNKLSEDYNPGENIEAREAFEKMKYEASLEEIYLEAFSTFRSYKDQEDLYNQYILEYGEEEAERFSAKAGFSEHQTGLAFDIGGYDRNLWAQDDFKYEEEAIWLKGNSYKYGFILRYPEGKEDITGYIYESWHFRYIGVKHSFNFKNNNLTLEEYLQR